jgi:hypothetical protein
MLVGHEAARFFSRCETDGIELTELAKKTSIRDRNKE